MTHSRHRGLVPLRRIFLNAAGENPRDTTYIEFNSLLCEAGWEEAVAGKLAGLLQRESWDEFSLDGFQHSLAYDALKRHLAGFTLREKWRNSYHVDLAALRQEGRPFEASMSGHRRKLLRQNLRSYSRFGPLQMDAAQDWPAALRWFDELGVWNIRRSCDLGRRSVFVSAKFKAFHRALIRRSLADGAVQLLRLRAGDETVGLLYNLVDAGKVCFYQSGFNYGLDKRSSPGTVTLAFAIERALEQGFDDWDFLAGEDEYKKALATGTRSLVWAVFRRSNFKTRLDDAVQHLRSRLVAKGLMND
jgi:CelD/BcsL family acetyltransferase involved in cellulose biosynthesis